MLPRSLQNLQILHSTTNREIPIDEESIKQIISEPDFLENTGYGRDEFNKILMIVNNTGGMASCYPTFLSENEFRRH